MPATPRTPRSQPTKFNEKSILGLTCQPGGNADHALVIIFVVKPIKHETVVFVAAPAHGRGIPDHVPDRLRVAGTCTKVCDESGPQWRRRGIEIAENVLVAFPLLKMRVPAHLAND